MVQPVAKELVIANASSSTTTLVTTFSNFDDVHLVVITGIDFAWNCQPTPNTAEVFAALDGVQFFNNAQESASGLTYAAWRGSLPFGFHSGLEINMGSLVSGQLGVIVWGYLSTSRP